MDNSGRTTRGMKQRASTGGEEEPMRDGIGRRSRSSSPKMDTRKRKHPIADLLDKGNEPESAGNPSKKPSVQPPSTDMSNGDLTAKNGSSKTDNARHYTRSKRVDTPEEERIGSGRRRIRQAPSFYRPEEPSDDEEEEATPIQVYATLLASLDERAHHRALMQDADALVHELLIPMALPWTHRVVPVVRNIPYDIDDLTEVLVADDGSYTPFQNGPVGFGRFDSGQLRRGNPTLRLTNSLDAVCSASRRSADVGVIEISTVSLPPNPGDESHTRVVECSRRAPGTMNSELKNGSSSPPINSSPEGEMSLRIFEEAERRKIQRRTQSSGCARKKLISVRVNSSSSRSKILPSSDAILEARLPAEVQNGKTMSVAKGRKIVEELGSFNVKDGAGKLDFFANSATRIPVGRCQVMWSQKSVDQPSRGVFFSRLTGDKLESGSQKRPTEIRVCLKVDGEVVKPGPDSTSAGPGSDFPTDHVPRSSETVGFGVDESFSTHVGSFLADKQCTLDSDKLIARVSQLADQTAPQANDGKVVDTATPSSKSSEHGYPRFECLPCFGGQLCTVCISPGTIRNKSVHEPLNNAAKLNGVRCTVCWRDATANCSEVRECSQCGLLAHPTCCQDTGDLESLPDNGNGVGRWKCAVCKAGPLNDIEADENSSGLSRDKRISRPPAWLQEANESSPEKQPVESEPIAAISDLPSCASCPFVGGAMSPCAAGREGTWIHEVCRLWAQEPMVEELIPSSDPNPITEVCALCGAVEALTSPSNEGPTSDGSISRLIKCAGSRCGVYFHPMCALLSQRGNLETKISTEGLSGIEKAKSIDRDLCSRFTLSGLRCEYLIGDGGKNPGRRASHLLRIGFCGLHNPKRDRTFQGLYPGGSHTETGVLTIPSLNRA